MNLYERGVKFISDLFDKDGKIYTLANLCNKYGVTLPIISYYGLRRAIFSKWPQLQNISNKIMLPLMPVLFACQIKVLMEGYFITFYCTNLNTILISK